MIIVDAIHGERAPAGPALAALAASKAGAVVELIGDPAAVDAAIAEHAPRERQRLTVIPSGDPLRDAARRVADGRADAVVSAASAPALAAAGVKTVGLVDGVGGPALAAAFATLADPVIVLDLGVGLAPAAPSLVEHARLGVGLSRALFDKRKPEAALLAPRRADDRSAASIEDADRLLSRTRDFGYSGRVDGTRIFEGVADVVVTDGATGQLLVETIEGLANGVEQTIRGSVKASVLAGAGALLLSRIGRSLSDKLEFEGSGAGVILGLRGLFVAAHRRSGEKMMTSAIGAAQAFARRGVLDAVEASVADDP